MMKTSIQSSPTEILKSSDCTTLADSDRNHTELPAKRAELFPTFRKIWQFLNIAIAKSNEIHVWEKINRFGNREWHIYDPNTGRSTSLSSDAQVRIWLDQNHY